MKKISTTLLAAVMATACFAGNGTTSEYNGRKHFTLPATAVEGDDYLAKTVILKFKEDYRNYCTEEGAFMNKFSQLYSELGGTKQWKKFKFTQKPEREFNPQGIKYADLSLIYEFEYSANVKLQDAINMAYNTGLVEYAEPHYIPKTFLVPNDPLQGNQAYLNVINAYQAWDTQTGDVNVVIGITDTGIDIDHSDLDDAIAYNTADPIGGGDDDNDGYIDNYRGWDVGMNDNNPQEQGAHGCHVSGCASPETDNGTGIAGPGFNTKILPVKISNAQGALIAAYEGITYAADHGCDIINCSWGGGFPSQSAQDVVTYATINKDALVIAAAGNDGQETDFYPAAYDWVTSVAATQNNDAKAGFSNYGTTIDVCAPGQSIYSTVNGNNYANSSGTSMACPVAAGAAAIIKSQHSTFNAIQVAEQLKATCDNIDAQNSFYIGKLGGGRINMAAGVGPVTEPAVVVTDRLITDNDADNTFVADDTLDITHDFTNYLANTGSLTATLVALSSHVTVVDNSTTVGTLNTLQTKDHNADPFKVYIKTTAPLNTVVPFKLTLDDGNYSVTFDFDLTVNVDYINIAINDVASTITSKNGIGYNAEAQVEGLGFEYPLGTTVLYDAGFMMGVPGGKVSDHVRDPSTAVHDDFVSVQNVRRITTNPFSDFDVNGTFNDDGAGGNKLDVEVEQNAYAWNSVIGHTKYIIYEYIVHNTGTSTLSDFYAGIYVDWDIEDFATNRADQDNVREMGYAYSDNIYAGTRVLTDGGFKHYAMDNDGSNGSVDVYTSYNNNEKYTTLSTNRAQAGPGDISDIVSSGPYNIAVGDSAVIAFALLAGDDLNELNEVSDSAYSMYNNGATVGLKSNIITENALLIYPNPAKDRNTVAVTLTENSSITLQLYDVMGKKVATLGNGSFSKGIHKFGISTSNMPNGVYFYQLNINGKTQTKKLTIAN